MGPLGPSDGAGVEQHQDQCRVAAGREVAAGADVRELVEGCFLEPAVEDAEAAVAVGGRAGAAASEQLAEERLDILSAGAGKAVAPRGLEVHYRPPLPAVKSQVNRCITRAASSIGRAADS